MIKYEDYRNDKNFKIDSLTYSEIFCGIKEALLKVVAKNENLPVEEFVLLESAGSIRNIYGKDKDLYPQITIELNVVTHTKPLIFKRNYFCKVDPFEIELLSNYYGEILTVENELLNKALVKFMCEHFPNSDYLEKREKYFKDAEIIRKTEENLLNF